ncbi:MAG: aspartate--tRNA ligase [Flavobacteriales bacterium]|nr:aspartate--tRNA ligase [Flavobacteriales bacterium]MCB9196880.1 aspartate--tRNA ligase [Flavobacteriales bacterium]
MTHVGQEVVLVGWVQKSRDLGGLTFVDVRDRYGITQLAFNMDINEIQCKIARTLGREFVVQAKGKVAERSSKNKNIATGDVEIVVDELTILKEAKLPPFTIEDETDGGDELRMKYRFLDLRRNPLKNNLLLRHQMGLETRKYLSGQSFIEVETPYLIKSTPEGARDFVVPSRMNAGEFYALPQSPQTFKQLLMVSGYDRYFQIVKCFRDEDLRADRQPEFTQIDCEMAFVEQEDILMTFEGLIKHLFKTIKGVEFVGDFPRMTYAEAMERYGSDKPDIRFGMELKNISHLSQNKGFQVFDDCEAVLAICAKGCSEYTRKQLDGLTEWVKRPQIGAKGMVYVKYNTDGTLKSSVDKFYSEADLKEWADCVGAERGDLILVLSGGLDKTRKMMNELRLFMGTELGLRNPEVFKPLWVMDFPLLEWDEESERYHAMHHPFTSPKKEDFDKLETAPGDVRANAYDLAINGVEVGGGSIRIHDSGIQSRMFDLLGFTKEQAKAQFGFLMNAFEYGAPPHGGIAFGFDRLCSMFGGQDSIRDFIAFPKNNSGRDMMIDAPSVIDDAQLTELSLKVNIVE